MGKNNYFQFKQFRITQEHSAMKVGIDGVLLGAWTNVSDANHILDIGTGTGLIALMLAQKAPAARIDAVEIDQLSCNEAISNISNSPWPDSITVFRESFLDFAKKTKTQYHLIVSNPPFFTDGVQSPDKTRARTRHSDSLPLPVLIENARRLLVNP